MNIHVGQVHLEFKQLGRIYCRKYNLEMEPNPESNYKTSHVIASTKKITFVNEKVFAEPDQHVQRVS